MAARTTLGSDEVARLMAACTSTRERLVMLALVETGLGASELIRLERADLDPVSGTVRVVGRAAPVLAPSELQALLTNEFERRGRVRLGIRQIQRIVRRVARKAGLETVVTPDVLRRTWMKGFSGPDAGSRRCERLLEAAAEAALDLMLVADDDRRFVDLNRAAADALGLPRERLIGRRVEDFFSEAQGKAIPSAWDSFVADGEQSGVCQLKSEQGSRMFEYRAKAHFRRGLHLSVLRELRPPCG